MTYLVGLGRTGGVLQIALGFTGVTCMGKEQPAAAGQATPGQGRSVARGSPAAFPARGAGVCFTSQEQQWGSFGLPRDTGGGFCVLGQPVTLQMHRHVVDALRPLSSC